MAISYEAENTTEKTKKTPTNNQKWNNKTRNLQEETAKAKETDNRKEKNGHNNNTNY